MSLKDTDMELLERKYAMFVLLALDKRPMSTKTEIMRMDSLNEKTKFLRINELIAAGFIQYASAPGYSTKRLILTERGVELVSKLKKVRAILLDKNNGSADEEYIDEL